MGKLIYPLDTAQHITSAREKKQSKPEYQQLLDELNRLNVSSYILKNCGNWCFLLMPLKTDIVLLSEMARASISVSQQMVEALRSGLSTQIVI